MVLSELESRRNPHEIKHKPSRERMNPYTQLLQKHPPLHHTSSRSFGPHTCVCPHSLQPILKLCCLTNAEVECATLSTEDRLHTANVPELVATLELFASTTATIP